MYLFHFALRFQYYMALWDTCAWNAICTWNTVQAQRSTQTQDRRLQEFRKVLVILSVAEKAEMEMNGFNILYHGFSDWEIVAIKVFCSVDEFQGLVPRRDRTAVSESFVSEWQNPTVDLCLQSLHVMGGGIETSTLDLSFSQLACWNHAVENDYDKGEFRSKSETWISACCSTNSINKKLVSQNFDCFGTM